MKIRNKCPHCSELFELELPEPKPKKPFNEPEEETETSLTIGEINITTKSKDLQACKQTIESLIKNKSVKNYLNSFEKKKFILNHTPSYLE